MVPEILAKDKQFNLIMDRVPHIGAQLSKAWGYPEFMNYTLSLIADSRDGTREGFPTEIGAALIQLIERHIEQFPHCHVDAQMQ